MGVDELEGCGDDAVAVEWDTRRRERPACNQCGVRIGDVVRRRHGHSFHQGETRPWSARLVGSACRGAEVADSRTLPRRFAPLIRRGGGVAIVQPSASGARRCGLSAGLIVDGLSIWSISRTNARLRMKLEKPARLGLAIPSKASIRRPGLSQGWRPGPSRHGRGRWPRWLLSPAMPCVLGRLAPRSRRGMRAGQVAEGGALLGFVQARSSCP